MLLNYMTKWLYSSSIHLLVYFLAYFKLNLAVTFFAAMEQQKNVVHIERTICLWKCRCLYSLRVYLLVYFFASWLLVVLTILLSIWFSLVSLVFISILFDCRALSQQSHKSGILKTERQRKMLDAQNIVEHMHAHDMWMKKKESEKERNEKQHTENEDKTPTIKCGLYRNTVNGND